VVLRKPSDYFKKDIANVNNSVQELIQKPELSSFSEAFDSFKNNLTNIEVLSEKVEDIQEEIQTLLKKEDLDRAMMSQLLILEQSIRDVQSKVSGINEKNLRQIRNDVSGLSESVNEFLEVDVPKYKKLVVESELRTGNRFIQLEDNVNQTLEGIGEFVDDKYQKLTETLQGINEQSLSGILEDFKVLGNIVQEFKEQEIPKYKGFIVETERKTESKLEEFNSTTENKLNEFQEKLDETVSGILEKVSSIDVDNTNLIDIINQKIEDVNKLSRQVGLTEKSTEDYKNQIKKKVSDLEVDILRNETHIKVQNKNLEAIQEEVKETLGKINLQELENQNRKLGKKIKYLEEVFEKFSEKEILLENIIVEPPSTDNKDPLTPLDQNFITLDQLQQHYRLFINRIQQQLATIGGGGETRLEFLDDVDRNSAKVDGRFLKYDAASGKWIGAVGGGGGSQTLDDTLGLGNTSSLGMSVGVITATYFVGDGSLLTNISSSSNSGYATSAGIATYASSAGIATYASSAGISTYATNAGIATYASSAGISTYATNAGIATYATNAGIATYASSAGIATYATNAGIATYADNAGIATYATNAGIATYATNAGISTYASSAGIATYATSAGIATYATSSGIATVAQGLTGTPNINVGIVTATSYNGSGINLTGIVTSIAAGSGISVDQSTGNVTITATGGGAISIKDEGSILGTAVTSINFVGSGVIATGDNSEVTVTIDGGVGIATAGGTVGTGVTLFDFRGPGISTVTVSSGIGTINITGGTVTSSLTIGTRTTAQTINLVGVGATILLRSGIGTLNF
jgi:hypothetical protein